MEIEFTSLAQANAVYDVVEHRVLSVPTEIASVPHLEQDEAMELVAFLHRLQTLIRQVGEQ